MTAGPAFCTTCGAALAAGDRFCRSCGAATPSPGAAAEAAPADQVGTTPPVTTPSGGSIVDAMGALGTGAAKSSSAMGTSGPSFGAPTGPPTAWTSPVGGPAGGGSRRAAGPGAGGGPGRLRRGTLGCLVVLIGLGVIGVIGSSLGDSTGTARPSATAPRATSSTGATAVAPVEPETQPPETQLPGPLPVELGDALAAGLVAMTADGRNLQELELGLDSLADEPITLVVPAGTLFKPGASGTQSMIVISAAYVVLDPGEHWDTVLDVACASMHRDTPGSSDSFSLATKPIAADLAALVSTPGFAAADFRVQQFAIWTITNNPARNGYVGLGTFGVGSGPSDAEIREIKGLFKEAGIDTSSYNALR